MTRTELTDSQYLVSLNRLQQRGRIELIMGCMFAGKSTELLRRCRKHEITGKKVLKVKFSADNRYDTESIATHNGIKEKAIPSTSLTHDLRDYWRKFDVIGIDEGQFFTDIVEFAEMAANEQKIVIIASLQGTFLRGCFQNILTLIPKCEKIKKLSAICKLCKQNASFTFRTAPKGCTTLIGGAEMYMPLCRQCHSRESKFNQENAFSGDPEVLQVDLEIQEQKNKVDDENQSPNDTDTSNSLFEMGSVSKSFSSDFENCDDDSLRQKQEPAEDSHTDKKTIKHFQSDSQIVTQ